MTSARAAAIVCDDIVSAADVLRRSEAEQAGADSKAAHHAHRLLGDMLGFWVSDGAFAMKRRLGMG
jgi:hypothetical protein